MCDYDFIIFYSSNYYNENALDFLLQLASKISDDNKKRVSFGYFSLIPFEKREAEAGYYFINLLSVKNGKKIPSDFFESSDIMLLELVDRVVGFHDELLNQKTRKKN